MSEWKTYKLGELPILFIDGDRGKNYPKGDDFSEVGHCLFLNAGNVTKNGWNFDGNVYISEEKDNLLRNGKLERGDIVLTTRGTVGNVVLYSDDIPYKHIRINSGMVIIRNNNTCYNPYLYQYLRSYSFFKQVQQFQSGSAQPQIPISTLKKLTISLPPLAEQKRIADILSAIDDKIELNRRINANLEQQAQSLYKSWFVDNKKDDWEEGVASDYFNITIGKTPPRKETKWFSTSNKDHVWISISDMGKHGMYLGQSSEYLTQSAIEKFNIVIVPDKTVLLSFKLTIGRVVISDGNVTTNEAIAHFNTNDQNLLEYTYLSLKNYEFSALGSTSSIATAVNSKTIKSMRWIMPNHNLIKQFHEKVGPLFNMIRQNEKEINHLSTLRDTLLPKLMSGEITI